MHINIVSPSYPTANTIDFVFVDQLCRALTDKGIKITIIAPQSITKAIIRRDSISSVHTVITTPSGNRLDLYRPFYLTFGALLGGIFNKINKWGFKVALRRAFKKLKDKPDVCYGHFWSSVNAIYPLAKKYNIPLIASSGEELVTIHQEISPKELFKLSEYISGVISVSTKNKNECINAGLTKKEDCIVIPNAVDTKLFFQKEKLKLRAKYGFAEDSFIVAFVGQFNSRKGAARLSSALTTLNDNSIKALFLGSGPEIPDFRGTLLANTVSHDILPDYLNCADVFVLPTLNEGCSNAIIEAMACGLPIISSDLPFNYDILNKEISVLIDPENINQIAEAIKDLKNNPEKRRKLSNYSLEMASTLSLSERAERVIQFIRAKV